MESHAKEKIITTIDKFVDYLKTIASQDPTEFERNVHQKLHEINELSLQYPELRPELIKYMFDATISIVEKGYLNTQSRRKTFGYTGDFLNMDYVMTLKTDPQGEGKLWDELYHKLPASLAVRNRKEFFCKKLDEIYQDLNRSLSVLDIVGGSCRDVRDALMKLGEKARGFEFQFVDSDPHAIAYARNLLDEVPNIGSIHTEWTNKNIFRFKPEKQYDFIWCLGLFDYLKDHVAISLLKKMWDWTRSGGRMIFGNFHPKDPSRNYFVWIIDWILIYRVESELIGLCTGAGIPRECIEVQQEASGVNLFCVVTKPK
jgi:extracellular factor (EF) 3-hydroxypalmitic acid methyl ester biosynthesis protein